MSVKKPPCFTCKERQAGCHAGCDRYAKWSKARRDKLEEVWSKDLSAKGYQSDKLTKQMKYAPKKGARHKNV